MQKAPVWCRATCSGWADGLWSNNGGGTRAALLARNGPSRQEKRCGVFSIGAICRAADILMALHVFIAVSGDWGLVFMNISLLLHPRLRGRPCPDDAAFEGPRGARIIAVRNAVDNDAFYLELLLEPGSIPWYVVVVVIFARWKKNNNNTLLLTSIGCSTRESHHEEY